MFIVHNTATPTKSMFCTKNGLSSSVENILWLPAWQIDAWIHATTGDLKKFIRKDIESNMLVWSEVQANSNIWKFIIGKFERKLFQPPNFFTRAMSQAKQVYVFHIVKLYNPSIHPFTVIILSCKHRLVWIWLPFFRTHFTLSLSISFCLISTPPTLSLFVVLLFYLLLDCSDLFIIFFLAHNVYIY